MSVLFVANSHPDFIHTVFKRIPYLAAIHYMKVNFKVKIQWSIIISFIFLNFHQIFPQFLYYMKNVYGCYFRNYFHPIRRNSRLASVASDKYSILKAKWSISLLKFLNCSTEIISRPFQNCPQDCLLAFQRQFDRNNYQITNPRNYVPT